MVIVKRFPVVTRGAPMGASGGGGRGVHSEDRCI